MDVVPDPKLQSCTFSYTLSASTNILIGLLLAAGLGGGSLNKGFYIPLNKKFLVPAVTKAEGIKTTIFPRQLNDPASPADVVLKVGHVPSEDSI
jgi:hypothetical protein